MISLMLEGVGSSPTRGANVKEPYFNGSFIFILKIVEIYLIKCNKNEFKKSNNKGEILWT